MGNDESKENENNKINMEEIIENDCYEEVNIKKINKILEEEKKWNKNSIIYTIKDLNFLDIEEEKKKFQIDNRSDKEKSNEKLLNKISEENLEIYPSKEIKNGQDKEQNQNQNKENIQLNENNNNKSDKNKENKENEENGENDGKKEEINNIDNSKNENQNNIVVENNNNEEANNKEKEKELNQNNKITNLNNNAEDISKEKQEIKQKKNGDANPEKINSSKLEKIHNNLKVNNLNYKTQNKQKLINELFDIKNIVPEYRLNHLKEDELIFSGTVDKITKVPGKENKISYSERFCVLTKKYFAYYKSKESYISLNKPLLLINNNNIKRIEYTSFKYSSYYFGVILEINDETKYLINKVNSFVTNEDNSYELLLGFRTKEFKDMVKWVIILTYFTTKTNGEENQDNITPEQ